MTHPTDLDRSFAALREASSAWHPPVTVDAAIATAIQRASRRQRIRAWGPPRLRTWLAAPLALAAVLALVVLVVRSIPPRTPFAEVRASAPARATFTPVVPVAEIAASADAYVVPARVPRMTFAQFGVPVDPARADLPVDTELLLRGDGALLAYRFVN